MFWRDLMLRTETDQSPAILNLIISRVLKESTYGIFLAVLVYRYLSLYQPFILDTCKSYVSFGATFLYPQHRKGVTLRNIPLYIYELVFKCHEKV